jgi:hypothetical protein
MHFRPTPFAYLPKPSQYGGRPEPSETCRIDLSFLGTDALKLHLTIWTSQYQ